MDEVLKKILHKIKGGKKKTRDEMEQIRRENESFKKEVQEMRRMLEKKEERIKEN